jgi:hypothetical protein
MLTPAAEGANHGSACFCLKKGDTERTSENPRLQWFESQNSLARRAEVIAMFSNRSDQGERIGRLLRKVIRDRKSAKLKPEDPDPTYQGAQVDQLVAEYADGRTTYELAAQSGIHRVTVLKLLDREGVYLRNGCLNEDQVQEGIAPLLGAKRSHDFS